MAAHDDLEDLVRYYALEISAAFNLGNGPVETPCSHHILPMTRAIPSMRCVVAATAACHLANRFADDRLHRRSLHLRLKATELLRAELESGPDGPDLARLLCMLLLAQLDVCSGDCVEFTTHLKAARTFIRLYDTKDTERSFIEQRLAWLDIMEATTNPRMPHLATEDIKRILNKFRTPSGERLWGLDVFHCPIDLFEHLADVVVLYESQPKYQETSQNTVRRATGIGNAVKDWAASADSEYRRHLNEVWRIGILLYLVRIFRLPDDIFDTASLSDSIFLHARSIPSKSSWRYSTSWPLFQAGLLLLREDSHTKTWLRNELYENFSTLGCFHQKLAVDALEQAWQSGKDSFFGPLNTNLGMRKLILY
ncbi:uncharacterized protein A1O9_05300 [Exophiala aquamarina CBS 119918]|uniref:Transcription factor domain-containing protein n=1 Tax=Exophiala aquamarina CBS 119918 TaxID=1182545 RepID=A0A072PDL9_9EURO|nr:uncharacterized protein A1O9_05300 [Exophiala aquamarina CBS 119918]KEF57383.1 hypothetical protein A1O9_05300 [Exophiala aquamarina CBS 119918]